MFVCVCVSVCMYVCMYGPVSRVPESVSLGDHTIWGGPYHWGGGPGIRSPDSYIHNHNHNHNHNKNKGNSSNNNALHYLYKLYLTLRYVTLYQVSTQHCVVIDMIDMIDYLTNMMSR